MPGVTSENVRLRVAAFAIALGVLVCAAAGAVLAATSTWGIGMSNDSASYLQGARNLLAGHGVTWQSADGTYRPIHFPPLYSVALAVAATLLRVDVEASARFLNALLAAVNVCLVCVFIYYLGQRALPAALFGALLVLTNLTVLPLQTSSLSEPLFLCLVLATLLALARYVELPSMGLLVAAAVMAALAVLTRYAGVALVIAGVGAILLLSRGPRLISALVFGISAVLPLGIWLLANQQALEDTSGRQLAFHLPTRANFDGIQQLFGWLLPSTVAKPLANWFLSSGLPVRVGFAALLLVGLIVLAMWSRQTAIVSARKVAAEAATPSLMAVVLFIPVYVLLMLVSIVFFDAATSLGGRILSPVYEVGIVACCALAAAVTRHLRVSRPVATVLTAGLAAVATVHIFGAGVWLATTRQDGLGYSGPTWRTSPTLARVSSLPETAPVYTNVVSAVYCVTGRLSNDIPVQIDPRSRKADPRYEARMASLRSKLALDSGVVVLLTNADGADLYPAPDELAQRLDLQLIATDTDGAMYRPRGL